MKSGRKSCVNKLEIHLAKHSVYGGIRVSLLRNDISVINLFYVLNAQCLSTRALYLQDLCVRIITLYLVI